MNRREVSALIASRGDLDEQEREEVAANMEAAESACGPSVAAWAFLAAVTIVAVICFGVFWRDFKGALLP